MNRKSHAEPTATATEVIAALDRRINDLNARDRDLLAEQLVLEKAETVPIAPSTLVSPRQRALTLLNGSAPQMDAGRQGGERLYEILFERRAIAEAVEIGGREALRARLGRVAEILEKHRAAWRELVRQ